MHVLLIEDDPLVGEGIETGLGLKGIAVTWLRDGNEGRRGLEQSGFDAVILDLALPGCSGLELLRRFRSQGGDQPVVILTAFDDVQERIAGLDCGADDYVTKPFDLEELAARLRAVQRRSGGHSANEISHGALVFDPIEQRATLDGICIDLSRREAALLHLLLDNRGRVVSFEKIQSWLYGWGEGVESNAVTVHIHNLRRKLGRDLIENVRGLGYRIPGEWA